METVELRPLPDTPNPEVTQLPDAEVVLDDAYSARAAGEAGEPRGEELTKEKTGSVPADDPEAVADPAPPVDKVAKESHPDMGEDKEAGAAEDREKHTVLEQKPAEDASEKDSVLPIEDGQRDDAQSEKSVTSLLERKPTITAGAELAVLHAVEAPAREAATEDGGEPEQAAQLTSDAEQPEVIVEEEVTAPGDDGEGEDPAEPEPTAEIISLADRRAAKQQETSGNGGNGDDGGEGGEGEGPERPNQQALLHTLDEITRGPEGSPFGLQPEEIKPGQVPRTAVGGRLLETTVEIHGEDVEVEIIKSGERSPELAAGMRRHGEIVYAATVGVGFGTETLEDKTDISERRGVEIFAEIPENGPTLWTVSAVSADKRNTPGVRHILKELGFEDLTFARAGKVARFKFHEQVSEDRALRLEEFLRRHMLSPSPQESEDV